jgi:hypothetical protein
MLKSMFQSVLLLFMAGIMRVQAQSSYSTFTWPSFEDASIKVSVDKPTYFAGDSIILSIRKNDGEDTVKVIPMLTTEGIIFKSTAVNSFYALIPQQVIPESYRVKIKVPDAQGNYFFYETNCFVNIEEHQAVEKIDKYVRMSPDAGAKDAQTAVTLERKQIQDLQVIFKRKKIRKDMGPQFVTITTTVLTREENTIQTFERRILTFRSSGDPNLDHMMFTRYRKAFGTYAAILSEELEQVHLQLDSLPDWAIIKVNIQPDYTIKIGTYDRLNSVTYYYRVKGPAIETGFALAFPKVIYDTQAKDSIKYGKISAMIRFYYVKATSGHRFPVNLGIGTLGVNSPIDIGEARGGIAASIFLDVIELIRNLGFDFSMKVNAGLELMPFFSIKSKPRILLNAQVGFAI